MTNPWVVQKFGGTSIGKYPLNIVEHVIKPATARKKVVVVCSARSSSKKDKGTTNRLLQAYKHSLTPGLDHSKSIMQTIYLDHIDAASNYVKDPYLLTGLVRNIQDVCAEALQLLCAANLVNHDVSHIRDRIISTGEVLACHFLCAVLEDRGIPAEVVNLSEIISPEATTRSTQSFYSDISVMMADRICSSQDKIPVVTGFFGPIDGGLLNLIGRGYTDLCASLISIGLQASELQVWKEVEGIFTADPCKVPSARMIPLISSEEASELTFHGSEVIHYTAMRLAMRARIQIRIKNVMSPEAEGTLVRDDEHTDTTLQLSPSLDLLPQVTNYSTPIRILGGPIAITSKDNILLINLRSAERLKPHRFFASIFSILDRWNLSIDLLCTSEVQISLALHSEVSTITGDDTTDPKNLQANFRNCIAQLQEYGSVDILPHRTIVSIVGKQMKQELGTAGMMFSTLGENGICVEMIAQGASEISISCVVEEQKGEQAVALLHASMFRTVDGDNSVPIGKPGSDV